MKHKKLFIIMAVVVIMATFTISTFAEVPTEAVTGYKITNLDGQTNSNQILLHIQTDSADIQDGFNIGEKSAFIVVDDEFYFFKSSSMNDYDYYTGSFLSNSNTILTVNINPIDNYVNPTTLEFYFTEQAINAFSDFYGTVETETLTYTPKTEPTTNNIYGDIYTMVKQYIFGGAELTANQDLVATLTATWSCILLVMLPFIIVWGIFKLFVR